MKKIFSIFIMLLLIYASYCYFCQFNSEFWLNNSNVRNIMVEDLIESKVLIGKNKKEVVRLIGIDCKGCPNDTIKDSWMYPLKYEWFYGRNNIVIFDVYFDKGIVSQVTKR